MGSIVRHEGGGRRVLPPTENRRGIQMPPGRRDGQGRRINEGPRTRQPSRPNPENPRVRPINVTPPNRPIVRPNPGTPVRPGRPDRPT